jgi:hypothetical protein
MWVPDSLVRTGCLPEGLDDAHTQCSLRNTGMGLISPMRPMRPTCRTPGDPINQIIVHHGAYVDGIEIGWSNGTTSKHGESGGPNLDAFVLNPDEHLTAIDGTIGNLPDDGGPYVVSIRFVVSTANTVRQSAGRGSRHVRVPMHGSP